MREKLSTALALAILTVWIAATTARAQTVANGPYYAPPAWDQTLPSSTRFIVLSNFASNAVLDRETGLVWERTPGTAGTLNWNLSNGTCNQKSLGNRKGWRLPTVQELASLLDDDPTNTSSLRLPPGHPFNLTNAIQSFRFWSSTGRSFNSPENSWFVDFADNVGVFTISRSTLLYAWCVRGGQGVDLQ